MKDYKTLFKNKKITMLGLGLLGRGLNDAKFFAEAGAKLTITDLKTAEQLKPTLRKLSKYKSIEYVLGKHRLEDFRDCDFVLKSAGVPLDSVYIEEARKNNVPIEMDESLFTKLAPGVKVIGVTGTRGKTTTTILIYEILKRSGLRVHLGGNIKGLATLPLLKKVKDGDIVVMELSSWQLQGFGQAGISPHISVFTNIMDDHLNYYKGDRKLYFKDKSFIYKFQKKSDYLICGRKVSKEIGKVKSKKMVIDGADVKGDFIIKGKHNIENIAFAVKVAELLGVEREKSLKIARAFGGVEGRQELIREIRGVKIYNNTTATTPDATSAALASLGKGKNIVLIMGGTDKNIYAGELVKDIKKYCKYTVLLSGSGTEKVKGDIKGPVYDNLRSAVVDAFSKCKRGDVLLFSPSFTSFGMFKNEYDRGEKFNKIVKKIKK